MAEGANQTIQTESTESTDTPTCDDLPQWVCNKCKLISRNEEVAMLECDLCERHLCIKCAKVTITHYKRLAKIDTMCMMWFCSVTCVETTKTKLRNETQITHNTFNTEIKQITADLEDRIT